MMKYDLFAVGQIASMQVSSCVHDSSEAVPVMAARDP